MFRKKILVVDDSIFFTRIISNALTPEGYDVMQSHTGEDCLRFVREIKPDLVLLDVVMPGMSGFDVCRVLRSAESNNLMPIIMLTGQQDHEDMLIGLDLGADDYIVKPFDNRELLYRVKNTLKRIDRNRNASPLTGLPGNLEIQRELDSRIASQASFAAIYADLDNFKAYNDVYGFLKGDIAIKLTADILQDEAKNCDKDAFIGHIGGDDLIVIIDPTYAEIVSRAVIEKFDARIREIYSAADLEKGHIDTNNREGNMTSYPIMTISLAVVSNEHRAFSTYMEIADIAAELKKKAKSLIGSCYVKDMRLQ